MSLIPAHEWGLQREIVPRFGARLVQEGNRLHYLADRAGLMGNFSDTECFNLNDAFLHFISQMESMLTTGELTPCHHHCVTLYHNGFTCEADTLAVAATCTSPLIPLNAN